MSKIESSSPGFANEPEMKGKFNAGNAEGFLKGFEVSWLISRVLKKNSK